MQLDQQFLPRQLSNQDISSKSWCFSHLLFEHISTSNYLKSRIQLDKDAIILQQVNQVQIPLDASRYLKFTVIEFDH